MDITDIAVTLVNAFVVVAVGAFLAYLTNDRYRELRREIKSVRQDLARLEARMDARMDALRSDLTRVALAVGAGGTAAEG